jgi:cytochrome P450
MVAARPPLHPGLPVLGSLMEVRRDMLRLFERAATLGDVVQIDFPGRHGYLVVHPDQVKQVLVDEHPKFGKNTAGYRALRVALGQGLVTSQGDFWRRQRRIAQPAFHHQKISGFAEIMVSSAEDMLAAWAARPDGAVIDVDAEMMAVTLRIVGLALMGVDLSDDSGDVGAAVTVVLKETVHRIVHPASPPLWVPTGRNRRFNAALGQMNALVRGLVAERRGRAGGHGDLLDMLMSARDEETGEGMTDDQLRDEVLTMVSAGHETTANALAWTFHLLAGAPEAQDRLHAELDAVLAERPPTLADLPRLTYTEAVVKESMRLLPPVWMIARSVEAPTTLGGFTVAPPRSMVFLCPWVTHRDPRFWPQPMTFRPERFLDEAEVEARPKYAYFPFAGGPRVCIGNAFAMMEAKLLLAAIARRFQLATLPGHPVVPEPTVTLRPRYGLKMILSRR